jgi:uncharacterized protein YcfJ
MKESTLTGVLAGAAVVTAGLAFASFRILEGDAQFAEVLAVQPIVESVQRPRQECPEELIVDGQPVLRDPPAVKTAMVVPGLPAQASTDNAEDTSRVPAANCRTVYDSILQTVGYDVVYRLGDRQGTVRMDHDPGDRIPVKDGELVLQPPTP